MLKLASFALAALLGLGMAPAIASTYPAQSSIELANALERAYSLHTTTGNSTAYDIRTRVGDVSASQRQILSAGISTAGNTSTINHSTQVRVPGTTSTIPATAKIQLTGQVVGKTLARAALVYTAWEAGSALYDIWADAGLQFDPATGAITDPNASGGWYQSVGVSVRYADSFYGIAGPWEHDYTRACNGVAQSIGGWVVSGPTPSNPDVQCTIRNASTSNIAVPRQTQSPTCPASWWVGPSGQCQAAQPSSSLDLQQIADHIAARAGWPDSTINDAVRDALKIPQVLTQTVPDIQSAPLAVEFPGGAQSVAVGEPQVQTITRTLPDGATETITRETTRIATRKDNFIEWSDYTKSRRTVTNPDGSVVSDQVTEETTQPVVEENQITCGLPNTPACKIDEQGVEKVTEEYQQAADPETQAAEAMKPLADLVANPEAILPELPTFNWSFSLPTGCGVLSIPAFSPWIPAINVCQFQSMFHNIMSVVWVIGGLLGAIGLFWRDTIGKN